jgi:hypothetical protein
VYTPWIPVYDRCIRHVDEALRSMDLFDLVRLKEDYYPKVSRKVFCAVYIHDDVRTSTWMTVTEKFEGTFDDFVDSLGYMVVRESRGMFSFTWRSLGQFNYVSSVAPGKRGETSAMNEHVM